MVDLHTLREKLDRCFTGAAITSGCTVDIQWSKHPRYNVKTNHVIGSLLTKNMKDLGFDLPSEEEQCKVYSGSTDLGNVSHCIPSVQVLYSIPSEAANHTPAFTSASSTPEAHENTWKIAKALAATAIDFYADPDKVEQAKKELECIGNHC